MIISALAIPLLYGLAAVGLVATVRWGIDTSEACRFYLRHKTWPLTDSETAVNEAASVHALKLQILTEHYERLISTLTTENKDAKTEVATLRAELREVFDNLIKRMK